MHAHRLRRAAALVLLLPLSLQAAAPAVAQTFLAPAQVDLLVLLPPFPALGSPIERAELAELMERQRTRTPERVAQARADIDESVFTMFAALMGPGFTPAALPVASGLFTRLGDTEEVVNGPVKGGFARLRPYLAHPDAIQPAIPISRSGSYPSGHSTRVTILGIVLAAMVPERRDAIFARMADYADSRLWGGVHYPSDVAAGRLAGTAIDAVLFDDPAFKAAFAPARAEVRSALGLAP